MTDTIFLWLYLMQKPFLIQYTTKIKLCIKSNNISNIYSIVVIFIIAIIYAYILMQSCFGHCKNYIYIYFFFFKL